jgi:hypothetical protein
MGAALSASGTASVSADTFTLHGTSMPDSSSVLYFQGTTAANGGGGMVFGDGLRCAGGTIVRLAKKVNVAGASSYPEPGETRISVQGGVAGGNVRKYQCWYRNAASFCTSATFNLSNGLSVDWRP